MSLGFLQRRLTLRTYATYHRQTLLFPCLRDWRIFEGLQLCGLQRIQGAKPRTTMDTKEERFCQQCVDRSLLLFLFLIFCFSIFLRCLDCSQYAMHIL
jgi:hypothetical protein